MSKKEDKRQEEQRLLIEKINSLKANAQIKEELSEMHKRLSRAAAVLVAEMSKK